MSVKKSPATPDMKTICNAQLVAVKTAAEQCLLNLPDALGHDPEHLKQTRGHLRGVIEGTAAVIEAVGREW